MILIAFTYAIVTGFFTLFYVFMVLYYLLGWQTIPTYKSSGTIPRVKICVVVAARNEQKNIIALLECFKRQSYAKELFEVIIVDDHSDDLTPEMVENFDMDNLHLLHLKDHLDDTVIAFKKRALELAVNNTTAELIVTTDADCIMSEKWLENYASFYEDTDSQFIVAPVDFKPVNSLLEILQELDFLSLMAMTGASVEHKFYNLSNGANMAYTRDVYLKVNGYDDHPSPSGDDVFLIEKIGKEYPEKINYLKSREAIVYTQPCTDFVSLVQQRMRWISKTKHYTNRTTKLMALGFLGFYSTLLLNGIASFFHPIFLTIFITQVMIKAVVDFALLEDVSQFFQRKKLLRYFPVVELVHFPFNLFVGIASQFFPYKWKNRKVKT